MNNETIIDWASYFNSKQFEEKYTYDGDDLGLTWVNGKAQFKVWSPVASSIKINFYTEGEGDNLEMSKELVKEDKGVFSILVDEDVKNKFYTYSITMDYIICPEREHPDTVRYAYSKDGDTITVETVDVYAKAVGVNGKRGMVVDLSETNPEGFDKDVKPELKTAADTVIYEIHVRDFSIDESSGMKNKGKFLAFTEHGTKNADGMATGVDYLKELGITHIHLLPSYDYGTVDESRLDEPQFNWGYDPVNYNVPEGSYSTNPYDGRVRIKEFKEMVASLHKDGIRVVMDVVYNHTYSAFDSCFTYTVPNYYYRTDGMITSNGSGCGNETASDRSMVRKYIIDSVLYWAKEYHVDGFRFDLMAIHDIDTINELKAELAKLDPSIIVYGEGWTGGPSVLDPDKACFKRNAYKLKDVAVFNDNIRDAIKGSVMDQNVPGFINGGLRDEAVKDKIMEQMRFAVIGAVKHPQVVADEFWANSPLQSINYVSAHDNWALFDKLMITMGADGKDKVVKANKLAAAIYMTAQGIPFFQAGEEILRTKPLPDGGYDENSYKSNDQINSIKWNTIKENKEVLDCYKELIKLKKDHKAFRLEDAKSVAEAINFIDGTDLGVIAYELKAENEDLLVVFNGNTSDEGNSFKLPHGKLSDWEVLFGEVKAVAADDEAVLGGLEAVVLAAK